MNTNKETRPVLAFLGDSITEGWGLADWKAERYTTILQEILPDVKILNFGSSGATLQSQFDMGYAHTLAYTASLKAYDRHPFDTAFFFLGANDVWYWTSPETFRSEYESLLDQYRKSRQVLITPLKMKAGTYETHKLEQIRSIILSIAKERDLPVIDLYACSDTDWLSFDGVHPNAEGQKKIAGVLLRFIDQSGT